MKKIIVCLLIFIPLFVFGQAPKKILIKTGKLFNSETGIFQPDMAIIVSGNLIEAVKPLKDIPGNEMNQYDLIDLSKYDPPRAGMPISEILKAATINAARQLNWSDKIGIIKEGFFADIIAVDKGIEKDMNAILKVHFVMKDGKVYINNQNR